MVVASASGGEGNGEVLVKGYKLPVTGITLAKRTYLNCFYHISNKKW